MRLFLIISFLTLVFAFHILHKPITKLSYNLQKQCNQHSPTHLKHSDALKALICGSNLKSYSEFKSLMIQSQLIHIIVVSGSHLLVLRQILKLIFTFILSIRRQGRLPPNKLINWAIEGLLFFYCLLTGFQAPVVRALTYYFLTKKNESLFWSLSPIQLQFLTTLLLLMFFPDWWHSFSFILSSLASTALCLPIFKMSQLRFKKFSINLDWTQEWQKTLWVHFTLSFVMSGFSFIGFLSNVLFATLVGSFLFPIAIVIYVCHVFSFYLDYLFSIIDINPNLYFIFNFNSNSNSNSWSLSKNVFQNKLGLFLGELFDFCINSLLQALQKYIFQWPLHQPPVFLSKPKSFLLFWMVFLGFLIGVQIIQTWNLQTKPRLGKFTVFKSLKDL